MKDLLLASCERALKETREVLNDCRLDKNLLPLFAVSVYLHDDGTRDELLIRAESRAAAEEFAFEELIDRERFDDETVDFDGYEVSEDVRSGILPYRSTWEGTFVFPPLLRDARGRRIRD